MFKYFSILSSTKKQFTARTFRSSVMVMRKGVPNALRQQVWLKHNGETYNSKCAVKWCKNIITPFNFEAGHNIPFSKGGETSLENLQPICSSCNKSMGNKYTIDQFNCLGKEVSIPAKPPQTQQIAPQTQQIAPETDTNLLKIKTKYGGGALKYIFCCYVKKKK